MKAIESALRAELENLSEKATEPVEVAVLDSGVDATHPDLAGRVVAAYTVELKDGEPAVVELPPDTNNDDVGHGTAVAGIIAELAPNARIVDVRVLGTSKVGAGPAMLAGLEELVRRRSRLVNISLAVSQKFAPRLWTLCEKAYRQNQILVASRRNIPLRDDGFPAEFSNVISVDRTAFTSPYKIKYRVDHPIEYVAHGEDVRVPSPGGGHTTMTGTSFATPTVAALCALLLGVYPELTLFELKTILKAMAQDT